jgi:hypothetical protein
MHGGVLDAKEPGSLKVIRELLTAGLDAGEGRTSAK